MSDIELIARGVYVDEGKVLLCTNLKKNNLFLPGGHIEWGESARTALRREIEEEMGLCCTVGKLLGVAEHTFVYKGERVCEINLVFALAFPRLTARQKPPSAEKKLEFKWKSLKTLARSNMEPRCLARSLAAWLRHPAASGNLVTASRLT